MAAAHLVERALVPILLQELLLPLRLVSTALLRVFEILFQPLFLGQRPPTLNLFPLEFAAEGVGLELDDAELAGGKQAVATGGVDVSNGGVDDGGLGGPADLGEVGEKGGEILGDGAFSA